MTRFGVAVDLAAAAIAGLVLLGIAHAAGLVP